MPAPMMRTGRSDWNDIAESGFRLLNIRRSEVRRPAKSVGSESKSLALRGRVTRSRRDNVRPFGAGLISTSSVAIVGDIPSVDADTQRCPKRVSRTPRILFCSRPETAK